MPVALCEITKILIDNIENALLRFGEFASSNIRCVVGRFIWLYKPTFRNQ